MSLVRQAAALAFGVVAFYGWSFAFQAGYSMLWSLAYAPEVPSRSWHYSVVILLCSALGLTFGAVVPTFERSQPRRVLAAFLLGLLLAACVVAFRYADGLETLANHLRNVGTYAFVLAVCVGSYLVAKRLSGAV